MNRRAFLTSSALVAGGLAVAPKAALAELTKEIVLNPMDYAAGPALPAWILEHWYLRFVRCMCVFVPGDWTIREGEEVGTIDLVVPHNATPLAQEVVRNCSPIGIQWRIEENYVRVIEAEPSDEK